MINIYYNVEFLCFNEEIIDFVNKVWNGMYGECNVLLILIGLNIGF